MRAEKPSTPLLQGYEQGEVGAQYQKLLEEISLVLGEDPSPKGLAHSKRYRRILDAAVLFAPALGAALRTRQKEIIRIAHDQARPLREYAGDLEYASLLEDLLAEPLCSAARAKTFLQRGGDVFGAFAGRWSGLWFSDNAAAGAFDHHWQKTQPLSSRPDILVQPVVMGRISEEELTNPKRRPKETGSDSKEPTPAVDAVSKSTGLIIGAVGYDKNRQRTRRPHVGYFADQTLLVWVAEEENGTEREPRYSCFIERRYPDETYRILGAQLRWERTRRRFSFERFMGSIYKNPLLRAGA